MVAALDDAEGPLDAVSGVAAPWEKFRVVPLRAPSLEALSAALHNDSEPEVHAEESLDEDDDRHFFNQLPGRSPVGERPAASAFAGSVSPQDFDHVVRTVWGEARGEPAEGQQAVAHVIANRAALSGKSPYDVVHEKGQFEPWATRRRDLEGLSHDHPEYQQIAATIAPVLGGEVEDPTGGATHFYAPKAQAALGRKPPAWDDGTGLDIGKHRFFRGDYGRGPAPPSEAPQSETPSAQPVTPSWEMLNQPSSTSAKPWEKFQQQKPQQESATEAPALPTLKGLSGYLANKTELDAEAEKNGKASGAAIKKFFALSGTAGWRAGKEGFESTNLAGPVVSRLMAGEGYEAFRDLPPLKDLPKDEITRLSTQKVDEGWADPNWWGVHISQTIAGSAPSLSAGAALAIPGGLAGPGGAIAGGTTGFTVGSAMQTLAPAYQKAVAEAKGMAQLEQEMLQAGHSPADIAKAIKDQFGITADSSEIEDGTAWWHQDRKVLEWAADRAIKESGIAAAFGAAMGLAPMAKMGGTTINALGQQVLAHPIGYALAQLGIIQPGLMTGQHASTLALEGKPITAPELGTAAVEGVGMGAVMTGAHQLPRLAAAAVRPAAPGRPAGPGRAKGAEPPVEGGELHEAPPEGERPVAGLLPAPGKPGGPTGTGGAAVMPDVTPEALGARLAPKEPPAPDHPTAEPVADLVAQARDLKDPDNPRQAVWLPQASLRGLVDAPPAQARTVYGAGVPIPNFDGQGGLLIAKDETAAMTARMMKDAGYDMQEIIGRLTGSGLGKPWDGTHVVQQVTPEGAVTRERLVGPQELRAAMDEFAHKAREVRAISPQEALVRRAQEIVKEREAAAAAAERAGTRAAPVKVENAQDVALAGQKVAEPTPGQAEAGNYQKGHLSFQGLPISIETARGGIRRGVSADGRPWQVEMPAAYGYVKGSTGRDGDHVDVYVGDHVNSPRVFVVDQLDANIGKFDEHKALLGFADKGSALRAYANSFSDGRAGQRVGGVTEMSVPEFKDWLAKGKRTRPVAKAEKAEGRRYQGPPLSSEQIEFVVDTWRYVREVDARPKPQTLSAFIVANGGLRDDAREVRHIAGAAKERPGLVNKNGARLDDAALRAWEQGFFPEHRERPTIAEFLDKLQDDLHTGTVVRSADETALDDIRVAASMLEDLHKDGVSAHEFRSERNLRAYLAGDAEVSARPSHAGAVANAVAGAEEAQRVDIQGPAAGLAQNRGRNRAEPVRQPAEVAPYYEGPLLAPRDIDKIVNAAEGVRKAFADPNADLEILTAASELLRELEPHGITLQTPEAAIRAYFGGKAAAHAEAGEGAEAEKAAHAEGAERTPSARGERVQHETNAQLRAEAAEAEGAGGHGRGSGRGVSAGGTGTVLGRGERQPTAAGKPAGAGQHGAGRGGAAVGRGERQSAARGTDAALDQGRAEARDWVLAQGRKNSREYGAMVLPDGSVKANKQTGEDTESFLKVTIETAPEMWTGAANSVDFHHNHPRSSSLSRADYTEAAVRPALRRTWVHGHDGSEYWAAPHSDGSFGAAELLGKAYDIAQDATEAVTQTGLGMPRYRTHLIATMLKEAGVIDYGAKLAPADAAKRIAVLRAKIGADIWDEAVAEIADLKEDYDVSNRRPGSARPAASVERAPEEAQKAGSEPARGEVVDEGDAQANRRGGNREEVEETESAHFAELSRRDHVFEEATARRQQRRAGPLAKSAVQRAADSLTKAVAHYEDSLGDKTPQEKALAIEAKFGFAVDAGALERGQVWWREPQTERSQHRDALQAIMLRPDIVRLSNRAAAKKLVGEGQHMTGDRVRHVRAVMGLAAGGVRKREEIAAFLEQPKIKSLSNPAAAQAIREALGYHVDEKSVLRWRSSLGLGSGAPSGGQRLLSAAAHAQLVSLDAQGFSPAQIARKLSTRERPLTARQVYFQVYRTRTGGGEREEIENERAETLPSMEEAWRRIGEKQPSGFYFMAGRKLRDVPANLFPQGGQAVINWLRHPHNGSAVTKAEIDHFQLVEKLGDKKPVTRDDFAQAIAARMFDFRRKTSWLNPERTPKGGAPGYRDEGRGLGNVQTSRGPRIPGPGLFGEDLLAFPKRLAGGEALAAGHFKSPHWDTFEATAISGRDSLRQVPGWGKVYVREEGQADLFQGANTGRRPRIPAEGYLELKGRRNQYNRVMARARELAYRASQETGFDGDTRYALNGDLVPTHSRREYGLDEWRDALGSARDAVRGKVADQLARQTTPDTTKATKALADLDKLESLRAKHEDFFAPGAFAKFGQTEAHFTPATPLDKSYRSTMVRNLLLNAAKVGADSVAIPTSETNDRIQANTHTSAGHFYDQQFKPRIERELRRKTGDGSIVLQKVDLPKAMGAPKREKPYTVWAVKLSPEIMARIRAEGEPMFAVGGEPEALTDVATGLKRANPDIKSITRARLDAGEPVSLEKEASDILKEITSGPAMMPEGVREDVVTKIEPLRERGYRVTTRDASGEESEFIFRAPSSRDVTDTAALFQVVDRRLVVTHLPFEFVTNPVKGILGQRAHENVHALRELGLLAGSRTDIGSPWSRLSAHADRLGVMALTRKQYWALHNDARAATASGRTLFEIYHDLYKDYKNRSYFEVMDQEAVAHMQQLYVDGAYSAQDVAPVKDLLDAMLSGEVAKGTAGRAAAGEPTYALMGEGGAQKRSFDRLGFYSKALETAKEKLPDKGTPEQMLGILRNNGVKENEIKATKLDEFLTNLGRESDRQNAPQPRPSAPPSAGAQTWYHGTSDPNFVWFSAEGGTGARNTGGRGATFLTPFSKEAEDTYGKGGKVVAVHSNHTNAFLWDLDDMPGTLRRARAILPDLQVVGDSIKGPQQPFFDALQRAGFDALETRAGAEPAELAVFDASKLASAEGAEGRKVVPLAPNLSRPKVISKSSIVKFLEDNRVEVREAVYGGSALNKAQAAIDRTSEALGEALQRSGVASQRVNEILEAIGYVSDEPNARLPDAAELNTPELRRLAQEALDAAGTAPEDYVERSTKWSHYSLDPSNPTYRESVLHLPPPVDESQFSIRKNAAGDFDVVRRIQGRDEIIATQHSRSGAQGVVDTNTRIERERSFRTGHFSEPNVIAHARISMQKDAQGRPVFLVDELQSDWGQKLRDGGARDEAKIVELSQQVNAAAEKVAQFDKRDVSPEAQEAFAASRRLSAEFATALASAPRHPLVNTTDQWTATAFRRLIRQAVEAGADSIAIVPGKVQNERYPGLVQRDVIALRYNPDTNGLQYQTAGGEFGPDHRWKTYVRANTASPNIPVADLPKLLGKERADALLATTREQINGVALPHEQFDLPKIEIGAEGMIGYYDRSYPRTLRELLKKMDPSISQEEKPLNSSMDGRVFRPKMIGSSLAGDFLRKHDGSMEAALADMRKSLAKMSTTHSNRELFKEAIAVLEKHQNNPILFHSFPLSDKVKASVRLEGQPLFAFGGDAGKVDLDQESRSASPRPSQVTVPDAQGRRGETTLASSIPTPRNSNMAPTRDLAGKTEREIAELIKQDFGFKDVLGFEDDTVAGTDQDPDVPGPRGFMDFRFAKQTYETLDGITTILGLPRGVLGGAGRITLDMRDYAARRDPLGRVLMVGQFGISGPIAALQWVSGDKGGAVGTLIGGLIMARYAARFFAGEGNADSKTHTIATHGVHNARVLAHELFHALIDHGLAGYGTPTRVDTKGMSVRQMREAFKTAKPHMLSGDRNIGARPDAFAAMRPVLREAWLEVEKAVYGTSTEKIGQFRALEREAKRLTAENKKPHLSDLALGLTKGAKERRERLRQVRAEAKALDTELQAEMSAYYRSALDWRSGDMAAYEAHPTEMLARSFEAYLYDKAEGYGLAPKTFGDAETLEQELRRHFPRDFEDLTPEQAAAKVREYAEISTGNYPQGQDRARISAAWDNFFQTLSVREAADGKLELYSGIPAPRISKQEQASLAKAMEDAVNIVGRIAGKDVKVVWPPEKAQGKIYVGNESRPAVQAMDRALGREPAKTVGGFYRLARQEGLKSLGETGGGELREERPAHLVSAQAMIGLATNDPLYSLRTTAGHEAWHHVEEALAMPAELKLLRSPAEMARMIREQVAPELRMAPDDPRFEAMPAKELRAIAFQRYRREHEEGMQSARLHIGIRRFFDRVLRIFDAIKNVLGRMLGKKAADVRYEDVFERARTGEMAERGPHDANRGKIAEAYGREVFGRRENALGEETNPEHSAWAGPALASSGAGSAPDRAITLKEVHKEKSAHKNPAESWISFEFHIMDGSTKLGRISGMYVPSDRNLRIEYIGSGLQGGEAAPNKLGPAITRRVLREVVSHFPDAVIVTGSRYSGARSAAGVSTDARAVAIPVSSLFGSGEGRRPGERDVAPALGEGRGITRPEQQADLPRISELPAIPSGQREWVTAASEAAEVAEPPLPTDGSPIVIAKRGIRQADGGRVYDPSTSRLVVKSKYGQVVGSVFSVDKIIQAGGSRVDEAHQGQGHGVALYQALADRAAEMGYALVSDGPVSRDAARVYEALARRGYNVVRHPRADVDTSGNVGVAGNDSTENAYTIFPAAPRSGDRGASQTAPGSLPSGVVPRALSEKNTLASSIPSAGPPPIPPAGGKGPPPLPPGPPRAPPSFLPPPPPPLKGRGKLASAWIRNVQPELMSDHALQADARFAKYGAARQMLKDGPTQRYEKFVESWDKVDQAGRLEFMDKVERGDVSGMPDWQKAQVPIFRDMLDAAYALEKVYGSTAEYVDNYLPHLWVNQDQARQYFRAFIKTLGPTWFQKPRSFDLIAEGIRMGFELRKTNPAELVLERLYASSDMVERVKLLQELRDTYGVARLAGQAPNAQLIAAGWTEIRAPDRNKWLLAPDIAPMWKNAVEAKGLWGLEGMGGDVFRGWMHFKNMWVPVKLALSLFHALHVLHINQSQDLRRAAHQALRGDFGGAARSAGSALTGPLAAQGGHLVLGATAGAIGTVVGGPIVGAVVTAGTIGAIKGASKLLPGHKGNEAKAAWLKPEGQRTPTEEFIVQRMNDGGFIPQMSEQLKIGAKRTLAEAWAKQDWWRILPSAAKRGLEKFQAPLFEKWIPALKTAAYLNDADAYFREHPEKLADPIQYRAALRTIAKQIDNQFGEMFYGSLFWNRTMKDAGIGAFLSLGWNLGFARAYVGGALEPAGRLGLMARGIAASETRQTIREASTKTSNMFVYVTTAMMIAAMMTYLLSGETPEDWRDYVFPRIGGKNPDGTPRRVTTMFYTREVPMAIKHIQDQGSTVWGLADMAYNKMMIQPFVELANNRNYFGADIRDREAPIITQAYQFGEHLLKNQALPIGFTSAKRAVDTGGDPTKEVALAFMGFGPAPVYASRTALENKIGALYREYVKPERTPYAEAEIRAKRREARTAMEVARQKGDEEAEMAALDKLRDLGGKDFKDTPIEYMFSRLPVSVKIHLLEGMSKEERRIYLPKPPKKGPDPYEKFADDDEPAAASKQ